MLTAPAALIAAGSPPSNTVLSQSDAEWIDSANVDVLMTMVTLNLDGESIATSIQSASSTVAKTLTTKSSEGSNAVAGDLLFDGLELNSGLIKMAFGT